MDLQTEVLIIGAVQVPDGAIDPFTIVVENARDAESRGARFFLHTEAVAGSPGQGSRTGSRAKNFRSRPPG